MKLTPISNTNFKSYVPVRIYARDQYNSTFRRVYKNTSDNNLKRFQRQVISNLNGTAKEPNLEFIKYYKGIDKDYAMGPCARSFYAGGSRVYLVTGQDVDAVEFNAKKIGEAKAQSYEVYGNTHSNYTDAVVDEYRDETNKYLKWFSSRLKNGQKQPLILKVYFDAVRDKKGKVKKFTLLGANFVVDEN